MNILFIYLYYRRMYTECCIKKCKIDNYQFLVKEKGFWERSSTYFLGSFLLRRRAIVSHQHIGLVLCLDSVAHPLPPHLLLHTSSSFHSFLLHPSLKILFFTVEFFFHPRLWCCLQIKSSCMGKFFQLTTWQVFTAKVMPSY